MLANTTLLFSKAKEGEQVICSHYFFRSVDGTIYTAASVYWVRENCSTSLLLYSNSVQLELSLQPDDAHISEMAAVIEHFML